MPWISKRKIQLQHFQKLDVGVYIFFGLGHIEKEFQQLFKSTVGISGLIFLWVCKADQ